MITNTSKDYKAGWGQISTSIGYIGLAIAMIVIGELYKVWSALHSSEHVLMMIVAVQAPEDCKNGASTYLLYGGIVLLVLNFLTLVAGCARQAALKDGEISSMENCGLCCLSFIVGLVGITFFVVLIWVRFQVFFCFRMSNRKKMCH